MKLESKRIFIPNLPEELTEDDVRKKFFKFGNVTSINIKQRKELGPRNDSYYYAYVNIDTDHQNLQNCFEEFGNKKWASKYVEVQLAKESFLERLKKERLESQIEEKVVNTKSKSDDCVESPECTVANGIKDNHKSLSNSEFEQQNVVQGKSEMFTQSNEVVEVDKDLNGTSKSRKSQKRKSEASCEENIIEDVSNTSLTNEYQEHTEEDYFNIKVTNNKFKKVKLKIEGVGNSPIIYNNTKVKKNKSKDPYRQKADDKRVNALIQMNKSNQQQKSLVKAALSNLESTKSKKIVFNDDDDESVETVQNGSIGSEIEPNNKTGHTLDKLTLFNDDDENDKEAAEINFGLKQQFQGKKGKELFELQTRFNNDKRFQLDERFANADDDAVSENEKEEGDIQHESRKQMEILSEVLGKKFELKGDKPRKVMRRFDPTNPEHSKYLITEKNDEPVKKKSKKEKAKEAAAKQTELPVVSQDTFYEVTDKLKEALTEKTSFSLLNMFGKRSEDDEPNADHEKDDNDRADEETQANSMEDNHKTLSKKAHGSNPFKYDSSDDEGDDSKKQDKTGQDTTQPKANERTIANNNFNQGRLWIEPFFFQVDDYRLQEGLDFMKRLIGQDDNENFQDVRHRLKKITKKKAHNVEVKQNKLIKKHSKNLKKKKKAK